VQLLFSAQKQNFSKKVITMSLGEVKKLHTRETVTVGSYRYSLPKWSGSRVVDVISTERGLVVKFEHGMSSVAITDIPASATFEEI
jgi:hypothetical protein